MVALNASEHIHKQQSKNLERILEEAHFSGELKLCGQMLKGFPMIDSMNNSMNYNLNDTVIAGL